MTGGRDERIIKSVEDIYDEMEEDRKKGEYYIYVVPKAAREGATTSFGSVAIDRNLPITLIEPTKSITTDTIGIDSIKYSNKPDTPMHYVYSNKHCLLIQEMISKVPALNDLPYILLPNYCPDCDNYRNCQYADVIREDFLPITAVNYSKLTYVIAGSSGEKESVASDILSKLLSSQIFVFDEVHYMQNLSPVIIPILFHNKKDDQQYNMIDLDKYRVNIPEKYNNIHKVLNVFERITKHKTVDQSCKKVIEEALSDNYWEKHISEPLKNPYCVKSTRLANKFAVEMCELVEEEGYGKLNVKIDLVPLYDLLNIVCAKIITVGFATGNRGVIINITSPNVMTLKMIKELLRILKMNNIRVILTSATIGDLESDPLSEYWIPEGVPIKEMLFGGDGSPLKTNERLLVLCDSAKLSNKGNYSLHNPEMLNDIANRIKSIVLTHGINNCKIVAKSINEAKILLKKLKDMGICIELGKSANSECLQITWYKGTDTIGVYSDKRVWITVGFAYKPVNRFNNVTSDLEASEKKSHLENHADFFQAIMRAKGEGNSLVIALGVTFDECIAATTWGTKRKIEIDKVTHEIRVTCDQYIPGPRVIECFSFEQMLLESVTHMNIDKKSELPTSLTCTQLCFEADSSFLCTTFPINNSNGNFETQKGNRILKSQFLNMILTDEKVGNCSNKDINQHMQGKNTLKTYPITADGKAKWIKFGDLNLYGKDRLIGYFNYAHIPYKIERVEIRNKEAYNVWIFLVPIQAKKAKHFAQYILNLLTVKKLFVKPGEEDSDFKCTISPEFTDQKKRKEHEIKLPCGKGSYILVDGEFKDDFEDMEGIELLDLTDVDVEAFGMQVTIFKGKFDRITHIRNKKQDIVEDIKQPALTPEQEAIIRQKVDEYFNKFDDLVKEKLAISEEEARINNEWQRLVDASKIRLVLEDKERRQYTKEEEKQLKIWWEGLLKPKYRNLLELSMAY